MADLINTINKAVSSATSSINQPIPKIAPAPKTLTTPTSGIPSDLFSKYQPTQQPTEGTNMTLAPVAKRTPVVSTKTVQNGTVQTAEQVVSDADKRSALKSSLTPSITEQNTKSVSDAGTTNQFYNETRIAGDGSTYTVSLPNPNYKKVVTPETPKTPEQLLAE